MKRRMLAVLFALGLCALLCVTAAAVSPQSAAEDLAAADVFRGTDAGFELDRAPTRSEAAVMLVRLYGAEEDALARYAAGETGHPFEDGNTWAAPYLAWLYDAGLVRGMSETQYGADLPCRARDYALFLLRALGYQDGYDFDWAQTEAFAAEKNVYSAALFGGTFTRGDLALMTWFGLQAQTAEGDTLLAALTDAGAIDAEAAKTLGDTFKKSPVRLSDGEVTLDAAAWRAAVNEMTVTVTFENERETLAADALTALTEPDGGRVRLRGDALDALTERWQGQYGTYDTPFRFNSYVRGPVEIDFYKCDYLIDVPTVKKQLAQAIAAMEPAEITAALTCYYYGQPFSLGQTYVEVDMDSQQLTFYKNGTLIVTTPIVTGMVTSHRTPVGLYYSHNKQTNCTLTGPDYEVFVKYWVSVIGDSIGLHDASWRSVFGGDQYIFNGSHGCVNIPEVAMVKIFNNIDDGTPVLLYGKNVWYEPKR